MLSDDLLKFIKDELAHLRSRSTDEYNKDIEKEAYAQTIKLSEEVGELSEAMLARFGNQKRDKHGKEYDLEHEIADVIIVALIIGEHLNIDVNKAMQEKVAKVIGRRAKGVGSEKTA